MVVRQQRSPLGQRRRTIRWRRQVRSLLQLRLHLQTHRQAEQHGRDGALHSQGRQNRSRTVLLSHDRYLTVSTTRAHLSALTDEAFIADAASVATDAASASPIPSASQRDAIEAAPQPLLVLDGPGAGKTFCLIERVRYLIERLAVDPSRICVFTFTNRAAGEIAERLHRELGDRIERVKRGTIHAFCAELLREFGEQVGLQVGFGIADEAYQRSLLRRLKVPMNKQKPVLESFTRWRFRGVGLGQQYRKYYDEYRRIIAERNV